METVDVNDLLRRGVEAAKQGQKERARELLGAVTERDPRSEVAWLWLATVAVDPQQAAHALETALEINPGNARARSWLESLEARLKKKPVGSGTSCPLCEQPSAGGASARTCGQCGAILDLAELRQALKARPELKRAPLEQAVHRLRALGPRATFESQVRLALALLNLGRPMEARRELEAAASLEPADVTVRRAITDLAELGAARAAAAERAVAPPRPASSSRRRVMVVDDSPTVRKIVGMTLERAGHEVVPAHDGFDALAKLGSSAPDLILMDITMPNMDGYKLCKLVRENPVCAGVPVVMLSSKDGLFDKARGKLAGCDDYITKPFKPQALLEVIDRYCAKADRARARVAGAA